MMNNRNGRRTKRNTRFNRRRNPRKIGKLRQNKHSKHFQCHKNMIVFISPQLLPYPPAYRTKLHCDIYGAVAAGAVPFQYSVAMNSCRLPYNTGGWPGALPAIATLNPTGFSTMCNANMYRSFRVYASTIQLKIIPQALSDGVIATITPSAVATDPVSTAVAQTQPFTKDSVFRGYSVDQVNPQGLRNSISVHKFIGVRKQAIEDDLSGAYTGGYNAVPATALYWVVNITTPDGVATSQILEYMVRMTYYVELYNQTNASVLET